MALVAHITYYRGFLVIDLQATKSDPKTCHLSLDNVGVIGQVIFDTGINLGVSKEALEAMKKIRPGRDGLGDIDWFDSTHQKACFSWIGGPKDLKKLDELETSRDWQVRDCVEIPNDIPGGAKMAIEDMVGQ